MATYSSVNQETIELFQYKEVVEPSTTFNKTLVSSVAANEMYELYGLSIICNDGDCTYYNLYGDYDSVVDNDGVPSVNGFTHALKVVGTGNISSSLHSFPANIDGYDSIESVSISDQRRNLVWIKDQAKAIKYLQGSSIKLRFTIDQFSSGDGDLFDTNIWLKRTIFAG
tara:strand:+ start:1067 stop:1573 length:507 start_codon:yes stop_codon:yes gene_type:complete